MDQSVRVLFVNSRSSLPLLYNDTVRLRNVEEGGIGEFENGSPQSHVELMYIKVTRCLLVLACTAVCTLY